MYALNTFVIKSLQQCLMLVLLVVSQQSGHITDSWIFTTLKTNKKIVMVNNTTLHGQCIPSSKCDRDSESNPTKLFFNLRQIQTDKECTDICCHTILNFSQCCSFLESGEEIYIQNKIFAFLRFQAFKYTR